MMINTTTYNVIHRTSALADMCSYSPAGAWKLFIEVSSYAEAQNELVNAKKKFGAWHDYKVVASDEIENFLKK